MTHLLALDRNTFNLATPVVGTPFEHLAQIRFLSIVSFIISALSLLGALAFFIYLLWGALQWIMAGGDKEGIEKAKKKITNAIIGIVILLSVYAIVGLVSLLFLGNAASILTLPIPTL